MQNVIILKPIGFLKSDLNSRYQTPQQGVLAKDSKAIINLNPKSNFEQAVKDLNGFDRLWIIYQFHLNKNWKPLVNPPRYLKGKIGVFATRAPYRPNQIGLSCVRLDKVDGLKIHINESDILDGSPVLDIKPYLPYSDSFPDVKTGWVKTGIKNIFQILFTPKAKLFAQQLLEENGINLFDYARVQLEFDPTDLRRKRINKINSIEDGKEKYSLSYQDWIMIFMVNEVKNKVKVLEIIFSDRKNK
jgi:tRNA (adenine37-N6)-methyltransferase